MSGVLSRTETAQLYSKTESNDFHIGVIAATDPEQQTMQVRLIRGDRTELQSLPINNLVTNYGVGFRHMPLSEVTVVRIKESQGGMLFHEGYDLSQLTEVTDNRSGSKQEASARYLQRYLDEGESQMNNAVGSEVYLSIDGNVLIKSQYGAFIKLDNYFSRLEGSFANLKYEMDRVRIRAGNVLRPTRVGSTEDQYIYLVDGTVKGADALTDEQVATATPIKEFRVQVGTVPGENYIDDATLSPSVGEFTIAERIVDEQGNALYSAGEPVSVKLKTQSGTGFYATADGSFFIDDAVNFSPTKIGGSSTDRTLRIRTNFITVSQEDEGPIIYLKHESGTEILLNTEISMQDSIGRGIKIDPYGITLNSPEAPVTILAKDIKLTPDGGQVTLGGVEAVHRLIRGDIFIPVYDLHVHAGPSGPPVVPLSTLVLPVNTLLVTGVAVS